MSHCLDHLDGHQLVVLAAEFAVILAQHGDAVVQAGLCNAFTRHVVLLTGNGGGGDAATVVARRVQGEAAPAAANLKQVVARMKFELATHAVELFDRGLLQGCLRVFEDTARVHHGVVKKQFEHLVAEIVVLGNVLAAALQGVAPQCVPYLVDQRHESARSAVQSVEHLRIAQEQLCQACEVVTVPAPGHVALACAKSATEGDVHPGSRVVDRQREVRFATAHPAEAATVVSVDQRQRTILQAVKAANDRLLHESV